jgi:subtilisin family serine protease
MSKTVSPRRLKQALTAVLVTALLASPFFLKSSSAGSQNNTIGINVLLNTPITASILADLGTHGNVRDALYEINAVALQARSSELAVIQSLPYVAAANPDAERTGAPVDTVAATNFASGRSTWDMDAINVTPGPGSNNRSVTYSGAGVYVAVLDTGLLDSWRQYFPQERIAVQYARSFQGGPMPTSNLSEQPNKWEHDQNSHGTHVTSTILGYSVFGSPVQGVAPNSTVIPVKVLNQNGSGWSSVIARGILYVAELKTGPLAGSPIIINMSLGGGSLDALEKAAIDYAISKGVIVVAAAGNSGNNGMSYPGAYAPVISVAASGWTGQWLPGSDSNPGNWWFADDVADPTNPADFYIARFSGRQKAGQELDVAAPGSWLVGPYQLNSGQLSYFYLSGTSQASPHVAGIAALMSEKNGTLTQAQVETILKTTAVPLNSGSRNATQPDGSVQTITWGPGFDPISSQDADGAGLALADAAIAATP